MSEDSSSHPIDQASEKVRSKRRGSVRRRKSGDHPTQSSSSALPQPSTSAKGQHRRPEIPKRNDERNAKKGGGVGEGVKPFEDRARTVRDFARLKGVRPIVGLTAYDSVMAKLASDSGADFILVGDSVGTTLLGYKTTIPVDMTDMVRHAAAVRRAQPDCLVVADLPFAEASFSFDRLLDSARRLMQEGGADAIKIEGGRDVADDIEKLVATGIPVLGHIGLLPQTVKAIGGYRKFGSDKQEADNLYTDAIALEEAGCFAVVAEMIDGPVAKELSKQILPPMIGIGSGSGCDGQILVSPDLLGYSLHTPPSFVKAYANLNQVISKALHEFVTEVRTQRFPA